MSRVAYSASKSEFMHDWENNLFMDKMREGARNNHIGGSPSEVNSWQNNAAKIYNLLKLSDAPADVFIAFEYKSPLAGRVDCMLFAKGTDGKKHIVHIELKQWSNGTVSQVYDTGVFKVEASSDWNIQKRKVDGSEQDNQVYVIKDGEDANSYASLLIIYYKNPSDYKDERSFYKDAADASPIEAGDRK